MINSTDLIKAAQELISLQIDGLNNLSKRFNKEFVNVIKLINNSKGKLVIIALGKSGIIGKKISATLNSTGTSASFIHASDALHGDLGSIQVGDLVMFISKSGRTNELLRIFLGIIDERIAQSLTMISLDTLLCFLSRFECLTPQTINLTPAIRAASPPRRSEWYIHVCTIFGLKKDKVFTS